MAHSLRADIRDSPFRRSFTPTCQTLIVSAYWLSADSGRPPLQLAFSDRRPDRLAETIHFERVSSGPRMSDFFPCWFAKVVSTAFAFLHTCLSDCHCMPMLEHHKHVLHEGVRAAAPLPFKLGLSGSFSPSVAFRPTSVYVCKSARSACQALRAKVQQSADGHSPVAHHPTSKSSACQLGLTPISFSHATTPCPQAHSLERQ